MPSVKYSRIDGRKSSSSSSYLSTMTLVVIVALCLVGVWMMTSSSSVIPIQNADLSSGANKDDVSAKAHLSDSNENTNAGANKDDVIIPKPPQNTTASSESNNGTNESSPSDKEVKLKQFEDNTGNLPKDATNGEANSQEEQNSTPVEKEKSAEKNQEDKPVGEKKKEGEQKSDDNENKKSDTNGNEKKSEESSGQTKVEEKGNGQLEQRVEEKNDKELNQGSAEKKDKGETKDQSSKEVYPSGAHSGLLNETITQNGSFSTQAAESKNEKAAQKSSGQEAQKAPLQEAEKASGQEAEKASGQEAEKAPGQEAEKAPGQEAQEASGQEAQKVYNWKLCQTTAGPDYIPCLDNLEAIRKLHTTMHYEHRERHCPSNPPTCLVPLPEGYQRPIEWPTSRDKIWYHNVPHTQLAEYKKDQNWVKVSGEYLTFPGGGTQFKHGALHYIDTIQQSVPDIAWGKRSRVTLDVGCGVASFGGYLFERDALTMSLAPKDEHEAQVQFALERGIPAVHAVMGTKRLPFPGKVFDVVHCARCRVPWHIDGGMLLLELNRLLRPGGFFVWSATPVYQKNPEDSRIWEAMKELTKSMCWEQVSITRDKKNGVGIAFYRKPATNECYEHRQQNEPPLCPESDDPNAAWNVSLQACIHKVPVAASERGSKWPEQWPARLDKPPYWLSNSQVGGVYGKAAPEDFASDNEHWHTVVNQSYLNGIGINWSTVRNVMDMRAIYGGFAAALKDMKVWVMNVVSVDDPDTLPIIYERGLIGTYHDWCESFSTYPRSYDLLHANHLFSMVKKKCNYMAFIAEVDRMLRPEGKLIVRDSLEIITELESMFKSMHWEIRMTYSTDKEGLLCTQKTMWRPKELEMITYAMNKGTRA